MSKIQKSPLHIHLLFHPQSTEARKFAEDLMQRFVEPPASGGLRMPVFFTPDQGDHLPPKMGEQLDLEAAEHTLVVLLADWDMIQEVESPNTAKDWKIFAQHLGEQVTLEHSPHHSFGIAIDRDGFGITEQYHVVSAYKGTWEQRLDEASLHIAIRAIQMLRGEQIPDEAPEKIKAPICLFLSHAKADLDEDKQDPVRYFIGEHNELPVERWFDSEKIGSGENFAEKITNGIIESNVVVAFLTDTYASRPWCRREIIDAKKKGVPILVLDALDKGEPRNFPYLGNLPTVHWQGQDKKQEARMLVDRAVRESLRFSYNRAVTQRFSQNGDHVLACAPEALTLTHTIQDESPCFLYPDPPLSGEELSVLQALRPQAKFLTPLTRIAQSTQQINGSKTIGVSISESDDLQRYGLSETHQQTLTDEIHLYLLLAGLRIGYGGRLKGDMSKANNFTLRLFELIRSYSDLAKITSGNALEPIINFAPWPLTHLYTTEDKKSLHKKAQYLPCPSPKLVPLETQFFPPNTPERRFAWTLGLSLMRKKMTDEVDARLVIGGKSTGFSGIYPGVFEEAWMSIKNKQPIYLVGAFGGISRTVIDHLYGQSRKALSTDFAKQHISDYENSDYERIVDMFAEHKMPFISLEEMLNDLQQAAKDGVAKALNNGLNEEENQRLFYSTDPAIIAELVLTGINRCYGQRG